MRRVMEEADFCSLSRQDLNVEFAHALSSRRFRAEEGERCARAAFARLAVPDLDLVRTRVKSYYEVVKMLEDYCTPNVNLILAH